MALRYWLIAICFVFLCSCNGYKRVPLAFQVGSIEESQIIELEKTEKEIEGIITEEEAIKLALKFNPDIRIPLVHERGWGDKEVQFRGVARPELDVGENFAAAILQIDVFNLYNLLSPTERRAWREMREAERTQAYAEQSRAVKNLKRNVRLAYLELARLREIESLLVDELTYTNDFISSRQNISESDRLLFSLTEASINHKIAINKKSISRAELSIVTLIGMDPDRKITIDATNSLQMENIPNLDTIQEMGIKIKDNNWELISLYSNYVRKEYELRNAYLKRWGSLTIGPSILYNRDEDSTEFGVSVRARIPWPSHMDDRIRDLQDERSLAAARYTAALHNIESEIVGNYKDMTAYLKSIQKPLVDVETSKLLLAKERDNISAHTYIDMSTLIFQQAMSQLDDIAKYKMSVIIIDSLVK